jgi:hypothetical protein
MPEAISDAIRLYGTDEPVEPPRILRAGPLTVEFEAGNLRHIRYQDREMIRAISFVVRDKNWGTYAPQISRLHFQEEPEVFRVSYEATVKEGEEEFWFSAEIEGQSDGSLCFSGKGKAISDFLTNRTGFVVLHPIKGVAGAACTIEHVDGTTEETRFPLLIDPVQPMTALRGIRHQFFPGLHVSCRMEGDTFEMEDQRNWTDASYKTYVRPLAFPWPYLIAKSETIDQKVTLSVSGSTTEIESVGSGLSITLSKPTSRAMLPLGLGLDPKDLEGTEQNLRLLRQAAPAHLVCYYDPRLGHSPADLKRVAAVGRALGVELWLEFVVPTVDHFERDIQDLGRAVRELDNPFAAVMISPAPDLKCTLPGSPGRPVHRWRTVIGRFARFFPRRDWAAVWPASSRNLIGSGRPWRYSTLSLLRRSRFFMPAMTVQRWKVWSHSRIWQRVSNPLLTANRTTSVRVRSDYG